MAVQIKRAVLPYEKRGKSFVVSLPIGATIERAGISPMDGEPSIWYSVRTDEDYLVMHKFVIIMDDEIVDDDRATHIGIWWEGDRTLHLYEHPVLPESAAKAKAENV